MAEQSEAPPPPFNQTQHDRQAQSIADTVGDAITAGGIRTVAAVGERVTRVETKIEGLERDTAVIRSTLHAMNGELQRSATHEANCARSLALIAEQTKGLPDLLARTLAFDELTPKIKSLIEERIARKGAMRVWGTIGGLVALLGTFASAAGAIALHFLDK